MAEAKQKIAILGAGPSALVAAFRLTQEPDFNKTFDVTVYQQGWRVGGKCATGRDLDKHMRLYEHGIHGFLGCYFNALTVMMEAFEALDRPASHPLATFEEAFYGMSGVIRYEMDEGKIKKWPIKVPTNPFPREKLTRKQVERIASIDVYALNMIRLGLGFILQAYAKTYRHPATQEYVGEFFKAPPPSGKHPARYVPNDDPKKTIYDCRIVDGQERVNEKLGAAIELVTEHLPKNPLAGLEAKKLEKAMDAAAYVFKQLASEFAGIVEAGGGGGESNRDRIRRAGLALDFVATILKGVRADGLLYKGFDAVDGEDHVDWMRRHGAAPETIASPLTSSTPNITYQYPEGDSLRPAEMAAGAYLHWTMMTFTYMGEFIQLFEAGSGETLIAPLHEALVNRGVKFAFFHTITDIRAEKASMEIEEIEIDVQATVKKGPFAYDPYVKVKGLQCWPDRPLFKQLEEGAALEASGADLESFWSSWAPVARKTLKKGEDFDKVIIGISVGALPFLTKSLSAANPAWRRMLDNSVTVATQAMQVWLNKTPWDLGWNGYTNDYDDYLLSANFMTQPNGQGDFTKYIKWENWPAKHKPESLLLLCGTIPLYHKIDGTEGPDFPRRLAEQVRHQSIQFLQATGGKMLEKATVAERRGYGDPFAFDFDLLHPLDPADEKKGAARFDDQYWRVNVNPSDHYVSSPVTKIKHRLYANETGFANLSIAGDWTRNGLNVGSMEGSVRSGLLAAEAILGVPHSKTGVIGFAPQLKKKQKKRGGSKLPGGKKPGDRSTGKWSKP